MRWRSHLATLAMLLVALLAAHFWQTRNVPGGPAPDFSALAVSTQDGAGLKQGRTESGGGRQVSLIAFK